MLDTPPAPEGYTYRWIRAELVGEEDRKNVMSRMREGFELVRAEEIGDFRTSEHGRWKARWSSSRGWFAFGEDS